MDYIENDIFKVGSVAFGGELKSIKSKKTGLDYLWGGDETHWDRSAPVLFPMVGKIIGDEYVIDDKTYDFPLQHGFARDREFDIIKKDDSTIVYSLKHDKDSLNIYPYKFRLDISYKLKDNKIETKYTVINNDDKDIYFTIGGHPALMCPIRKEYGFDDYYLEMEQKETLSKMEVDKGYFSRKEMPCLDNENIIKLNYDLFANDAIVFHNTKSNYACLKSDKHKEYIKFHYEGFPYIAFWTKKDAPFVCFEPWFGHSDYIDADRDFKKKEGIMALKTDEKFSCKYIMEIVE